jgi:hypothetical protein
VLGGQLLGARHQRERVHIKTRQQALTWCAAHYPDLPIKEDRPKRLAKTPGAAGSEQLTGGGES